MKTLAKNRAGLVAALWLGLLTSAEAETKTASGKSTALVRVARTEIFLAGDPSDTGLLESLMRSLVSEDPDWNQATVFSVRFSDPHGRRERKMQGHMVVTHPNGDQTFLEYDFKWKPSVGGTSDFELLARFVRGTGKFKGITGSWRERGQSTASDDTSAWQVEYSVP
jgi:hypothetical protein